MATTFFSTYWNFTRIQARGMGENPTCGESLFSSPDGPQEFWGILRQGEAYTVGAMVHP